MSVYFLSNLARIVSFSFDGSRYVHQSFEQKRMKRYNRWFLVFIKSMLFFINIDIQL